MNVVINFKNNERSIMPIEKKLITKNLYSSLVDDIEEFSIVLINKEGLITNWNKGSEKLFGYSNSEIISKHFSGLFDTNEIVKGLPEYILSISKTVGKFHLETWMVTKNGKCIWANVAPKAIFNSQSELIRYQLIIHDITEKVNAEKEIRSLAKFPEENPFPIYRITKAGYIIYSNQAGVPLLTKLNCSETRIAPKEIQNIIQRSLRLKQNLTTEIKFEGKWYLFNIIPFEDYVNMYGSDISYMKNTQIELLESKEKAENSDKLKSEFLAQISHEIRTPINAILSYISLIRDELEEHIDIDIDKFFRSINNGSKRLIRTIDLILNISELQTGTYELNRERLNLTADIIENLMMDFSGQAKEKNLGFYFHNISKSPHLEIDKYSITQVLSNLIDNAIKFTETGSVTINLFDQEDKIIVEIKDTGKGINPNYLSKLFEPFSQEEMGYTRSYEGNGLGLALAKKYCELNSANIEVESEVGKGSAFRVIFNKD